MDPITRFCAYALVFGGIFAIAYLLIWVYETWNRYSRRRGQKRIESTRNAFARSVERAGKKLQRDDQRREAVGFPDRPKKTPIRKAVGYFSDDLAQLLVK